MTEGLHRSADWARLSQAGFFKVKDEPGQIWLSARSPGHKRVRNLQIIGIAIPLVSFLAFRWIGLGVGLVVGTLPMMILVLAAQQRMYKFADMILYRPEGVYGFIGGQRRHFLPREAMQQIATTEDGYGLRSHRFVADVGYFEAFSGFNPTDQVLMNNILISAFSQPVHLDLPEVAMPTGRAVPSPSLRIAPRARMQGSV